MAGLLSGLVGGVGTLTKGVIPKFLLSIPIVLWDFTLVEDATPLVALGVIVVVDWLLGFARAIKTRNWSSKAMTSGAGKILAYVILCISVIAAARASSALYWLPWVTYGYIALTELTSILENLNDLGVKLPLIRIIYKFLSRDDIDSPKKSFLEIMLDEIQKKSETAEITKQRTQRIEKCDSATLSQMVDMATLELELRKEREKTNASGGG